MSHCGTATMQEKLTTRSSTPEPSVRRWTLSSEQTQEESMTSLSTFTFGMSVHARQNRVGVAKTQQRTMGLS